MFFRTAKWAKNTDCDKYFYSRYGIRLDSGSLLLVSDFDFGKHFCTFDVGNSSTIHTDNRKKKDNLGLGEGLTQILDD